MQQMLQLYKPDKTGHITNETTIIIYYVLGVVVVCLLVGFVGGVYSLSI